MPRTFFLALCTIVTVAAPIVAGESVQQVTARKDRCVRQLDRAEQQIEKLTDATERLRRLSAAASGEEQGRISRRYESVSNTIDFFRHRTERVRNQAARIDDQLSNVGSSQICPSCIASDADLLCRQTETLLADAADQISRTAEFEASIKGAALAGSVIAATREKLDTTHIADAGRAAVRADLAAARKALDRGDASAALSAALQADVRLHAALKDAAAATGRDLPGRLRIMQDEISRLTTSTDSSGDAKAAAIVALAQAHCDTAQRRSDAGDTAAARSELDLAEKMTAAAENRISGKR